MRFEPLVTVEECRLAGRQFGDVRAGAPRLAFEQDLVVRLASLEEALHLRPQDIDEVVAAFDQAAWRAWETGAKRAGESFDAAASMRRSGGE